MTDLFQALFGEKTDEIAEMFIQQKQFYVTFTISTNFATSSVKQTKNERKKTLNFNNIDKWTMFTSLG